jgi:NAD-dependent deacetylase
MSGTAPLDGFASTLVESKRLVVLTGAGISQESGVPTFRDALDGLWAQYDPTQLATPGAFRQNPKLVWDWYEYRRGLVAKATPNPGHYALAELETLLPQVVIVTQNVDGFHRLAGSRDIICLHGDIHRNKCFANCQGNPTYVEVSQSEWDRESGPPLCPYCQKAYVRPDVVWFEEALPSDELARAIHLSHEADVMLVIGTSGVVYPAAMLPFQAHNAGATILEINPQASQITPIARLWLPYPSGQVLPQVVEWIRKAKG